MNCLLRHSPSIHKGLTQSPFPTADLSFAWLGGYDGDDLVNTKGTNIPYVSGSGLDAIYDFSVLSDVRLDKSNATYWGASLNSWFYYNPLRPYDAKLKDYHYKYYFYQMASDNNFAFAKGIFNSVVGYGFDCALSGLYYKASSVAYGKVFEATLNRKNGGHLTLIDFNSDDTSGTNGYRIQLSTDERVYLLKYVAGSPTILFRTAAGYIDVNQDYDYLILRNETTDQYVTGAKGTFAFYIRGGSFGNTYILISTAGGSGTNPVTDDTHKTNTYVNINLQNTAGIYDYIRDIKQNDILLNTFDFTQSSGVFGVDNLQSISELLIYNTEQTGAALNTLYNYSRYLINNNKYKIENTSPLISFMGDSLTYNEFTNRVLNNLGGFFLFNEGIGGNTTAQMLARFQADVLDKTPNNVHILGGINDVSGGSTAAQIKSNLQDMYDLAANDGLLVVASTITPWDAATAPQQVIIDDVNNWILNTASNIDYTVDLYTVMEDPINPDKLNPLYDLGDGIHWNVLGRETAGDAVFNAVTTWI
jgi:hypothetical protein